MTEPNDETSGGAGTTTGPRVNELICWYQNMIGVLPEDTMSKLCVPIFSENEIKHARDELLLLLVKDKLAPEFQKRMSKKPTDSKSLKFLREIYCLLQEYGSHETPKFAALKLEKLPPISYDCSDVSGRLINLKKLQMQVEILSEFAHTTKSTLKGMHENQAVIINRVDFLESREKTHIDEGEPSHSIRSDSGNPQQNIPYVCNICGYTFVTKDGLDAHMPTHKSPEPFASNITDNTYENVHDTKESPINHEHNDIEKSDKTLNINQKEMASYAEEYSGRPQAASLGYDKQAEVKNLSKCSCRICNAIVYGDLEYTASKVDPWFLCPACEHKATSKASLDEHVAIHADPKPFSCAECDFKTTRQLEFSSHMLTHTKENSLEL